MPRKILDPTIEVPPIVVEIDVDAVGGLNDYMKGLGQYIPLMKFGENIIQWNDIEMFEMSTYLYRAPIISMRINDSHRKIRRYLKNNIDVGVCRIGYNNFRMQFKILFTEIMSVGDNMLVMNGILWDNSLFDTDMQESHKNKSIIDILTELCKESGIGLYVYENDYLTKENDIMIRANESVIEFIQKILNNHTDNLWSIDANHFLHVGDYKSMIDQEVAEYTLNYKNGEKMKTPQPMKFYQNIGFGKEDDKNLQYNDEEKEDYRLPVKHYIVDNSFSLNCVASKSVYEQYNEKEDTTVKQPIYGFGIDVANTYSGFKNHKLAYIDDIRRKYVGKQITRVFTDYIIPELNIFSIVDLELYRNLGAYKDMDAENSLDIEHSGKKLVIGHRIRYDKRREFSYDPDVNTLFEQEIICI